MYPHQFILHLRLRVSKRSSSRIAARPPTAAAAAAAAPLDDDEPFFPARALRIVNSIATFGLPALLVPLADPSEWPAAACAPRRPAAAPCAHFL